MRGSGWSKINPIIRYSKTGEGNYQTLSKRERELEEEEKKRRKNRGTRRGKNLNEEHKQKWRIIEKKNGCNNTESGKMKWKKEKKGNNAMTENWKIGEKEILHFGRNKEKDVLKYMKRQN